MKTTHPFLSTIGLAGLIVHWAAANALTAPAYTVHEWGTFTSVQGSDGMLIPWDPFVGGDLPDFVYTRNKPSHDPSLSEKLSLLDKLSLKFGVTWLQRMETPVIYFYGDAPSSVDVTVDFPSGLLTEWYPTVTTFGPRIPIDPLWPLGTNSHLAWHNLQILPESETESGTVTSAKPPPAGSSPNHYFAARQTSARMVQTRDGLVAGHPRETEKFLFYRGAGNFATPLRVHLKPEGQMTLDNQSADALEGLFLYETQAGRAAWRRVANLGPKEQQTIRTPSRGEMRIREQVEFEFHGELKGALVQAGLFQDEAEAMIQTWRDAWMGEDGLRVLYLLPRAWTDATLPLRLNPEPQATVRVMVGRAEIFRPETEDQMERFLTEFLREPRPETLSGMAGLVAGRFVEPALNRAGGRELARRLAVGSGEETTIQETTQQFHEEMRRVRESLAQQVREIEKEKLAFPETLAELISCQGSITASTGDGRVLESAAK